MLAGWPAYVVGELGQILEHHLSLLLQVAQLGLNRQLDAQQLLDSTREQMPVSILLQTQ